MQPGEDPVLDLYGKEAYNLYNQLKEIIPGFMEIDRSLLTMYISQLMHKKELEEKIKNAENEQHEKLLKDILLDIEENILSGASQLGLTPESRLKIEKHLKKKG